LVVSTSISTIKRTTLPGTI